VSTRSIEQHSDQELRNIIDNYRKQLRTGDSRYLDALEESARRKGHGLNFQKSFELIRKAAKQRRFLSYKQLADESGAEWSKVRYKVFNHLGDLIEYAHHRRWPLISAIVVAQPDVETGRMDGETLRGFVAAARALGHSIDNEEVFLRGQQEEVFAWAAGERP
jgi:hypothetical protein